MFPVITEHLLPQIVQLETSLQTVTDKKTQLEDSLQNNVDMVRSWFITVLEI